MVAAIWSGFGHAAWSAFGIAARLAGVSMIDGAMALTRMPRLATSAARRLGETRRWLVPCSRHRAPCTGAEARLGARTGGDADDAAAAAAEVLNRGPAAQITGDEIGVRRSQHAGLVGVGDAAHGEAAGDVNRRPEIGHAVIQACDVCLVGQFAVRHQCDTVVVRERRRFRVHHERDAAAGAFAASKAATTAFPNAPVPPVTMTVEPADGLAKQSHHAEDAAVTAELREGWIAAQQLGQCGRSTSAYRRNPLNPASSLAKPRRIPAIGSG